uniref:Uncharacterized protein n=1 Tax=Pyxicephalus adspersus TaxID=30357 RepID=A0AAV2ZSF1_PYXAD|nr:TPA: hypothetical protein GDO54_002928 [Pyxicephalus adspersus]
MSEILVVSHKCARCITDKSTVPILEHSHMHTIHHMKMVGVKHEWIVRRWLPCLKHASSVCFPAEWTNAQLSMHLIPYIADILL